MNGELVSIEMPEICEEFSERCQIILHEGDTSEFLRTIPSNTATLIVSSPPYNLGKKYEIEVEIEEYLRQQEIVIEELVRVLKDNGSLCWEIGNYVKDGEVFPLDVFYYNIFKRYNLKLRNRIIWRFEHGLHASKRFSGRYETILWFTKSDEYVFNLDKVRIPSKYPGKTYYKGANHGKPSGNPLGKNPSDYWEIVMKDWESEVWNIPNVKAMHPEKTIHPCQFPIELIERLVMALTNDNDVVLDPYSGVGSALIAGLKHKKRVIGCDKEAEYIKISKERIRDFYAGRLRIRELGKPVFVPTGREKVSQVPKEWQEKLLVKEDI